MPTKLLVNLLERVEFASKQWLAERTKYLQSRLNEAPATFADASFSFCEVYTDTPPSLRSREGQVAFHTRIAGGQVEAATGETDDVDLRLTADYNQVLSLATVVGAGDRGMFERAHREFLHRHGKDALVVKGQLPGDQALLALLQDTADHMARRTIPNLDLNHRIEHLGLAKNRDELDERGYTILEGAISEEFADEIREALIREIDKSSGPGSHGLNKPGQQGTAGRLLERGRIFEQTAQHPWVLAMAEHMVGRGCLMATTLGLRKASGDDTHRIHVDLPLIQEPFPSYSLTCTSIWALEEFSADAGPTLVVPGSYRENRWPAAGVDDKEVVPILMPKGSVAIWRGNQWHSASVRKAEGFRITLHQTYSRLYVRSIDGYMDIDPEILERNSPAFSTLCGFDDIFEKATDTGPYIEGAMYAMQYLDNYRGLMKQSKVI